METVAVQPASAADTRRRLIDVAVDLFTRHSFAGTSLQMIADRVGVGVEHQAAPAARAPHAAEQAGAAGGAHLDHIQPVPNEPARDENDGLAPSRRARYPRRVDRVDGDEAGQDGGKGQASRRG